MLRDISAHPCQQQQFNARGVSTSRGSSYLRCSVSGRPFDPKDRACSRRPVRAQAFETDKEVELMKLHGDLMKQIAERKRLQQSLANQLLEEEGVVLGDPDTYREPPSRASTPTRSPPPPPRPFKPPAKAKNPRNADVDDLELLTRQFENQRGKQKSVYERQKSSEATATDLPPEKKDPPLAGENVMKVVLVGAECAPWSKTGGLGDVMSALPKALARRGHRVMVVVPRYANYDNAWDINVRKTYRVFNNDVEVAYFHCFKDGVDYVFVDHPAYHAWAKNIYGGDRLDIQFRCALLCKAALEAPWHVPCGGIPYGDDNLVFIANDWHTALLPVYLQAHYRDYDKMKFARSTFVIHNIAHQGRAPMVELSNLEIPESTKELFRLDDPIGGEHMNIMKAGLITAHRIVAVSHGYAWECQTPEGGWGLDAVLREHNWKLRGIVNGIDCKEWNPELDEFLQTDGYANYNLQTLREGKAKCKAALQKEMGLPVDPSIPMLGFIGRLDYQKGVDLIRDNFNWMMGENVQLIMLGSGSAELENVLRDMEASNKDKCRGWVGFSVQMAHRITAAADMLLMPSRFEPCGLNQLYAMAYGTIPIVHAVGGLRDTVVQYNPYDNTGFGWTFDQASADKLRDATANALLTYRQYRDSFDATAKRGMEQDLSWDNAASQYEEVMVAAKYQW